jgi:hypothetical protein
MAPTDDVLSAWFEEHRSFLRPIVGVGRVAQFVARLVASRTDRIRVAFRLINEFPAIVLEFESTPAAEARRRLHRRPPQLVISIDLDAAGLIAAVQVVASPAKLRTVGRVADPVADGA